MTSLTRQLEVLRDATARQLTIEKKHTSLLFEKAEAERLDRETIHKIGENGLSEMKKVDEKLEEISELFDVANLHFQRSLITKTQNEDLSNKIHRALILLSPYMQHFACQQCLELLVSRYQIHAYDAQFFLNCFLPFHETNFFGRIISILEINYSSDKELHFLENFAKNRYPVPFNKMMKGALNNTHSLLTRITSHIKVSNDLAGMEWLETHATQLFSFLAKVSLGCLEDQTRINDDLLAKLVPIIANGLRSKISGIHHAALMTCCKLVTCKTLVSQITQNFIQLILLKMKSSTAALSISTLVVICQQQEVEAFSNKGLLKVLRRNEELGLFRCLSQIGTHTSLTAFLIPLCKSLVAIKNTSDSIEDIELTTNALLSTVDIVTSNELFCAFMDVFLADLSQGSEPSKKMAKAIYSICSKYPLAFDAVQEEWTVRDSAAFERAVQICELQNLLRMVAKEKAIKRTRRRSRSRGSNSESTELEAQPKIIKQQSNILQEMKAESQFARRAQFTGDPLSSAIEWSTEGLWDKVLLALEEIQQRRNYIASRPEEDCEDFLTEVMKAVFQNTKGVPKAVIVSVMAECKLNAGFVEWMITRQEESGNTAKRAKTTVANNREFCKNESTEQFVHRLSFSLELLIARTQIPVSVHIFPKLFDIIKFCNSGDLNNDKSRINQQLAIGVLVKILGNPGTYKISPKDLQMESVVEALRSTQSHHVLRDALQVLTAATRISPTTVTSHVMSVFTFMGSGLLRKDNELTLGIIEDALNALICAVISDPQKKGAVDVQGKLIEICRLLAISATDIPAHRRSRLACAVQKSIPVPFAWIFPSVLFERFCASWQRAAHVTPVDRGRQSDQSVFEDLSIDMVANYAAIEQLTCVLDILDFFMRLGRDSGNKDFSNPPQSNIDTRIFDRQKHTLPKLRHFRFMLIALVVKIFSNRFLYEKLSVEDDDSLFEQLFPIGKRLLMTSVNLDEFVQSALEQAEKDMENEKVKQKALDKVELEVVSSHRYWIALSGKADIVSDKFRHLLPGSVSARLIVSVLNDSSTPLALHEKALALCNAKLQHDGYFTSQNSIAESQLEIIASTLRTWIGPARSKDDMARCQAAALTLKLIAKRVHMEAHAEILTDAMKRCVAALEQWQTLDIYMAGNLLLLAGELMRAHNGMMLDAEPLLKICITIVEEALNSKRSSFDEQPREEQLQRRKRKMSISGRQRNLDTLLICTLTCIQRILDRFVSFVLPLLPEVIVLCAKLSTRFIEDDKDPMKITFATLQPFIHSTQQTFALKNTVQYRLGSIWRSMLTVEFRVMLELLPNTIRALKNEQKTIRVFFSFLAALVTPKASQWVVAAANELVTSVFLPGMEFRSTVQDIQALPYANVAEASIFEAFITVAGFLSELQLKPIMSAIVHWSEAAFDPNASYDVRIRIATLLNFANHFYKAFNSLAMPYFGRILELAVRILRLCNAATTESNLLLLHGKSGSVEAAEAHFVLLNAVNFIQNCAKHREFFTEERVELVADALVAELDNVKTTGHEERVSPHLADAVFQVAEIDTSKFQHMLNDIFLKTRSNKSKIRFRVLLFIERLFDRVGDSIAPHLPMVMPFLSELLEDENKQVEEQCDRIVRLLQRKFGADITEGFV